MTERFHIIGRSVLILIALSVQLSCTQVDTTVNQQNHPPVIEKINYDKTTYHNRKVTIDCIASDIDGDNLTYVWESKYGKIAGEGKSVLWTPPGNIENYPITLTVNDGKGGDVKKTIYILVVTNADGTDTTNIEVKLKLGDNTTVVIENQRIGVWKTASILCGVEDANESDLIYKWSADCGRIQENKGQANKISWIAPGVLSDCTVNITVTDTQKGSETKGQIKFKVFCCGKELTGD